MIFRELASLFSNHPSITSKKIRKILESHFHCQIDDNYEIDEEKYLVIADFLDQEIKFKSHFLFKHILIKVRDTKTETAHDTQANIIQKTVYVKELTMEEFIVKPANDDTLLKELETKNSNLTSELEKLRNAFKEVNYKLNISLERAIKLENDTLLNANLTLENEQLKQKLSSLSKNTAELESLKSEVLVLSNKLKYAQEDDKSVIEELNYLRHFHKTSQKSKELIEIINTFFKNTLEIDFQRNSYLILFNEFTHVDKIIQILFDLKLNPFDFSLNKVVSTKHWKELIIETNKDYSIFVLKNSDILKVLISEKKSLENDLIWLQNNDI